MAREARVVYRRGTEAVQMLYRISTEAEKDNTKYKGVTDVNRASTEVQKQFRVDSVVTK